jgi:hypothetical protein
MCESNWRAGGMKNFDCCRNDFFSNAVALDNGYVLGRGHLLER